MTDSSILTPIEIALGIDEDGMTTAKKLSMTQKNERGEEAREYLIRVEDGAKKMVLQL